VKLLDTTLAIDHLRGDDRATQLLERMADEGGPLLASEPSRCELLAGMRPDELDPTELFMGALTWVPVDVEIARGADLLTTNVRHFPTISELRPPFAT
jgi:predicted nucleic acid-binding protein